MSWRFKKQRFTAVPILGLIITWFASNLFKELFASVPSKAKILPVLIYWFDKPYWDFLSSVF